MSMRLLHGTCIAFGATGVLLRGPSGAGKSDLALRLIGRPDLAVRLVADDQIALTRRGGELWASAAEPITGMMEVRGVGLVRQDNLAEARLRLVLDLSPPGEVPRLPEATCCTIDGVHLPLYLLAPFEASAADKIALLVRSLDEDILRS
ncbi:MAG: HPr kinase/phosphatase C-terminal domain-containing protein [Alphaproteobacteria bacterium]